MLGGVRFSQLHRLDYAPLYNGTFDLKVCENCGQQARKMRTCSGCKTVNYCGVECQKQSWRSHKSACDPDFGLPRGTRGIEYTVLDTPLAAELHETQIRLQRNHQVCFPWWPPPRQKVEADAAGAQSQALSESSLVALAMELGRVDGVALPVWHDSSTPIGVDRATHLKQLRKCRLMLLYWRCPALYVRSSSSTRTPNSRSWPASR